jgi:hypothetical protein
MDNGREEIKQKLIEKFTQKLEQVLSTPTVTMTDIENVVAELQREIGKEAAESLLRLKKTSGKVL